MFAMLLHHHIFSHCTDDSKCFSFFFFLLPNSSFSLPVSCPLANTDNNKLRKVKATIQYTSSETCEAYLCTFSNSCSYITGQCNTLGEKQYLPSSTYMNSASVAVIDRIERIRHASHPERTPP